MPADVERHALKPEPSQDAIGWWPTASQHVADERAVAANELAELRLRELVFLEVGPQQAPDLGSRHGVHVATTTAAKLMAAMMIMFTTSQPSR